MTIYFSCYQNDGAAINISKAKARKEPKFAENSNSNTMDGQLVYLCKRKRIRRISYKIENISLIKLTENQGGFRSLQRTSESVQFRADFQSIFEFGRGLPREALRA